MNQQQFINMIAPMAQADMARTGILASLTMAQCILESGWGTSDKYLNANNAFGIKGDYKGQKYNSLTNEFVNGKWIKIYADFRKYPSLLECFADHSNKFLTMGRYKALRGETDYKKACIAVHKAGYASAPDYSQKLTSLIEQYSLYQYDVKKGNNMDKNNLKICIDAGHCDKFAGAGKGNQREEKDTIKLALLVEKYLKSFGHTVFMTRKDGGYLSPINKNTDLQARPTYANNCKADYFLSLHRNSSTSSTASGNEIWVYSKSNQCTIDIASCILKEVNAVAPLLDRGVHKGYTGQPNADYAINRISKMPSALLELSFISNDKDNAIFNANIEKYAQAVAIGICKGLGGKYNNAIVVPKPVPPKPVGKQEKYYVKVCHFANKTDAENAKVKIKNTFNWYGEVKSELI